MKEDTKDMGFALAVLAVPLIIAIIASSAAVTAIVIGLYIIFAFALMKEAIGWGGVAFFVGIVLFYLILASIT